MGESITVEPYGGVPDVVFWPLVLLLLLLAWRFRAHKRAAVWCALSALAILVLASTYIIVFGMTSLSVLHDFHVALAILGSCLLVIAAGVVQEITIGQWKKDRVLGLFAIGMGLVGLAMVIRGVVVPMQDLFLPRAIVEGDITLLEARARRAGNRPGYYIVHIGNTRVHASTPLYDTLRLGQHVRAEVSGGSDFIRRLERNPAPAAR
jgi:hypothetical protein